MAEATSLDNPAASSKTAAAPGTPQAALVLAVACASIAAIFWTSLVNMVEIWNTDPNYSHGFVVPVVSGLMAFTAFRRGGFSIASKIDVSALLVGLISIVLGALLHAYAWIVANLAVDVIALIFMLRGAAYLIGGKPLIKSLGFPILFLIFMAPLPIAWYQPIALTMQHLVSVVSTVILEAFGATVYREGYIIQLPQYRMEVGEACSGLRQLTAVVALAAGIGYFSGRGSTYRWTLGVLSIPIAIGANCIRVVLTGVILMLFGPEWAEGVFHTLEGLVMVGVAAALTVVVAKGLEQLDNYLFHHVKDGSNADPAAAAEA